MWDGVIETSVRLQPKMFLRKEGDGSDKALYPISQQLAAVTNAPPPKFPTPRPHDLPIYAGLPSKRFLVQASEAPENFIVNPVLEDLAIVIKEHHHSIPRAWTRPEASWRRMYLSAVPYLKACIGFHCSARFWIYPSHTALLRGGGGRLGEVLDSREEFVATCRYEFEDMEHWLREVELTFPQAEGKTNARRMMQWKLKVDVSWPD
jgi:hypothetical protein